MSKTVLDDGFQQYLIKDAVLVGAPGIPMLMNLNNTSIPKSLIPFTKAKTCPNYRQYVHFYMHDREFSRVLTATKRYLNLLKQYDGVITPDCSMIINQSACLQQTSTYFNRAVGLFLQKNGIPVIPNVRWSDESSFDYCFLGIPPKTMVCISTHGCIHTREQRKMFRRGIGALLNALRPPTILVHGHMPPDIFDDYRKATTFYRYPSQFEITHRKEGYKNGHRL